MADIEMLKKMSNIFCCIFNLLLDFLKNYWYNVYRKNFLILHDRSEIKLADIFTKLFNSIIDAFKYINPTDLIDILFVTVFIYFCIKLIKNTRAGQLAQGVIILLLILLAAEVFELSASQYILNSFLEFGVLAVIIIFQPELRSALEKVGRKSVHKFFSFANVDDEAKLEARVREMITDVTTAVERLAATKTGALIVIERDTKIGDIIDTGIAVDAATTPELITNIFFNKAPLHDGAMIIRNNRIASAGCWLPLSQNSLDSDLGTRHRAGLGASEVSDAIVIIVSEETGIISMAIEGQLHRRYSPDALAVNLKKLLIKKEDDKKKDFFSNLWKGRSSK